MAVILNPAQFANILMNIAAAMPVGVHKGLDAAGQIVETEAKRVLGTYDYSWPELAPATKKQRLSLGFPENEPLLRNGELRDSIGHTTQATEVDIGVPSKIVGDGSRENPVRNIGDVATAMELGTSRAPARSFLVGALVAKTQDVVNAIGKSIAVTLYHP